MSQTGLYIAIGVVVLLIIVVVVNDGGSNSSPTTPPKPIAPFKGWATGGNPYYIDYFNPVNQKWFGMASSDTTPIQCTGSLSDTQCETDLTTAGQICDNTSGCIGIIYNIADPTSPTAIPVNTSPTVFTELTSAANGGGAVFLTSTLPTKAYLSFTGVPNTTWATTQIAQGSVVGEGPSSTTAVPNCYTLNQNIKGSCGGILVPDYTSLYQQTHVVSDHSMYPLVALNGVEYDTLNTSAAPSTTFTSAIALTYNVGSG